MIRFGFITWDWKGNLEIGELNDLLAAIPNPMLTDFSGEMGNDDMYAAVHSRKTKLNQAEWATVYQLFESELEEEDLLIPFEDKIDVVENQPGDSVLEMDDEDFKDLLAAMRGVPSYSASIPITNPVILKGRKGEPFMVTEEMLKERKY